MTVQQLSSNISDDSDDMVSLPPEEETYRRKYQLLLERCEVLQQDNERIVNRFVFVLVAGVESFCGKICNSVMLQDT